MGLKDTIKSQLSKQVDKHGDKVAKGMTKAADVVSKKAGKGREGGDETSSTGSSADQISSTDSSADQMNRTGSDSDETSGGIGGAGEGPKGPLP